MQLLMRRPEVDGFICVAPPSNLYDFSFLAPCPSSGLILNGDKDRVVPTASVADMAAKVKVQKGIKITHEVVPGANHFFENKTEELGNIVGAYVDERMIQFEKDRARDKERERERELMRQRQRELERNEAQSAPAASTADDGDDE
jgi:dienelactone hydrolase